MTRTEIEAQLRKRLEPILHLNGCQQRTAGHNDALDKKGIDVEDMERLEKLTLDAVVGELKKLLEEK